MALIRKSCRLSQSCVTAFFRGMFLCPLGALAVQIMVSKRLRPESGYSFMDIPGFEEKRILFGFAAGRSQDFASRN